MSKNRFVIAIIEKLHLTFKQIFKSNTYIQNHHFLQFPSPECYNSRFPRYFFPDNSCLSAQGCLDNHHWITDPLEQFCTKIQISENIFQKS